MGVFIIAEAGVNHNGSLELAKKMVDAAKEAGADCIKFQTFKSEKIVSKSAAKANYQKQQTSNEETQYEMLRKLELSYEEFIQLNAYCKSVDINFMSTPFDMESIEFLSSFEMLYWKVPSGEITNLPYLETIASTGRKVIMSTGMSSLEEIEDAIGVLKKNGSGEITVLHCTSEYPAPYEEVNLSAMKTLADYFGVDVGYSDHTKGTEIAIAATAMGATVIEKHFTLDCQMEGPDHRASIEPKVLKDMVNSIRNVEVAIGDGVKKITSSEINNVAVVRKSIVAKRRIHAGEVYTDENLDVKRPGTGISPMKWYDILGQTAKRDYQEDELIEI
jgi:N,N'-diacetyllegionaminate synthase